MVAVSNTLEQSEKEWKIIENEIIHSLQEMESDEDKDIFLVTKFEGLCLNYGSSIPFLLNLSPSLKASAWITVWEYLTLLIVNEENEFHDQKFRAALRAFHSSFFFPTEERLVACA